ncbi:hypothetical protein Lal_00005220 [Lupinus albus]|nr:hypothetical protein Lal_00005220 [Lupinus albus]
MEVGDRAFFYHSNEGLEIVGIVEIVRTYYPDPSDESGRFGMVDVAPVMPVKTPVTLKQIKADPELQSMALVRQSRLSVCPVTDGEWARDLLRRVLHRRVEVVGRLRHAPGDIRHAGGRDGVYGAAERAQRGVDGHQAGAVGHSGETVAAVAGFRKIVRVRGAGHCDPCRR